MARTISLAAIEIPRFPRGVSSRMAGALGDTSTGPLLDAISTEHPSPHVRAAARVARSEGK